MDKFYQACFSRLGGSGRDAGWQLANTSPEIPRRLLEAFEQRQKGNEPLGSTPRNVQNDLLCALEINSVPDADGISITRIQYGVPCYGREGLFSHGFLFFNAYELLKNPNQILTVSDDNFCFRENEAADGSLERYLERTGQIPQVLERYEGWSVESARQDTGMSIESHREFVYCLYACWAKSVQVTVYVKTDGSDRMARALLYLAYVALPYSLRPRIVASTFMDAKNTTLIFTDRLPEGCRYFDPKTGNNNVLSDNQRKRWDRSAVASVFFDHGTRIFDILEQNLIRMGDVGSQDVDTLKMALEMNSNGAETVSANEETDPVNGLFDLLDMKCSYNANMEQQVARRLDEITALVESTGFTLNADMERMLNRRLGDAVSEELKKAGYRYNSAVLARMDAVSGAKRLKDNPVFDKLRSNLSTSARGRQVLAAYYLNEITAVFEDDQSGYPELIACTHSFRDLQGMNDLWTQILETARSILDDRARDAMRESQTEEGELDSAARLKLALEEYTCFAEELRNSAEIPTDVKRDVLGDLDVQVKKTEKEWLLEYDRLFREYFDPKRMPEYKRFYMEDNFDRDFLRYSVGLLQKYLLADSGAIGELIDFLDGGCAIKQDFETQNPSNSERKLIADSLLRYWADADPVQRNVWMVHASENIGTNSDEAALAEYREKEKQSYEFWKRAAQAHSMDMVWLMLEKNAALLCDQRLLSSSLKYNPEYWTDDQLRWMLRACRDARENGKRIAADCEGTLSREKSEREKNAEKERKATEKENRKRRKEAERAERATRNQERMGRLRAAWEMLAEGPESKKGSVDVVHKLENIDAEKRSGGASEFVAAEDGKTSIQELQAGVHGGDNGYQSAYQTGKENKFTVTGPLYPGTVHTEQTFPDSGQTTTYEEPADVSNTDSVLDLVNRRQHHLLPESVQQPDVSSEATSRGERGGRNGQGSSWGIRFSGNK